MKRVIFIIGESGSGKTSLAEDLTASKNVVWLYDSKVYDNKVMTYDDVFPVKIYPKNSEAQIDFIIIEMIDTVNEFSAKAIKKIVELKHIKILKPFKRPILIERPDTIIISNNVDEEDLIDFPEVEIIKVIKYKK